MSSNYQKTFLILATMMAAAMACTFSQSLVNEMDTAATMVATVEVNLPAEETEEIPEQATPAVTLNDFPDKEMIAENSHYSVYLQHAADPDAMEKQGPILILNKNDGSVLPVNADFYFAGSIIVEDDGQGNYLLMSSGTYTTRKVAVVSFPDRSEMLTDLCTGSGESVSYLFWHDFLIYHNCDVFPNRPWGAGEAPGIDVVNIQTGELTHIAVSDLTRQFVLVGLTGDTLAYREVSVDQEADWQNPDSRRISDQTFDLNDLP